MSRDPYEVLGVARDADEDTVRKAYRKRSAKYHPDNRETGDAARFLELNRAYETLTRGGASIPPPASAQHASGPPRSNGAPHSSAPASNGAGHANGLRAQVTLDFGEAMRGANVTVSVAGQSVGVRIPPGAHDGSTLLVTSDRWRGDLAIDIRVRSHPSFRREGDDLFVDVPLKIGEAYRGHLVRVPTPTGEVALRVPPCTQSGHVIVVPGRGVPRTDKAPGDLHVKVLVVYPAVADVEVSRAVDALDRRMGDPRASLRL